MIIHLTYDASTSTAPTGFFTAMNAVARFFEMAYSDPIYTNITIGWGSVEGAPLQAGALGNSSTYVPTASYASVVSALTADRTTLTDQTAVASLPVSDPSNGAGITLTRAEMRALGISTGTFTDADAAIGFDKTQTWSFTTDGTAVAGAYNLFSVAAHEVSETLGRISNIKSNGISAIDLFRYASAGTHTYVDKAAAAYFSVDGGVTSLNTFNLDKANGDLADWAGATSDAYNAAGGPGAYDPISTADLLSLDAIGYNLTLLDYSSATAGVYSDLSAGYTLNATAAGNGFTDPASAGATTTSRFSAATNVFGSAFNDRLYGTAGNNTFRTGLGNDIVYGNGGSDTTDYSQMSGGVYVDLAGGYAYKTTGAASFRNGAAGVTVAGTDTLVGVSNAIGTGFDDRLLGTSGDNTFRPGMGNDVIYGSGGKDTVDYSDAAGGVYVDLSGSYVYKTTGGASFRNGAGGVTIANTDYLVGLSNVVGSAFDDRLIGTAGDNTFKPGMGNDVIYGGGGNDTVDYSDMSGGVFADLAGGYVYKTDNMSSFRNGSGGVTVKNTDLLVSISNVTGTAFDDRLYGNAGNNTFKPGTGDDVVYGNGGTDVVDYSDQTGGVFVNLAASYAYKTTGGASFRNGAGGVTVSWTDYLAGLSGATGTAFDDRLYDAAGGHGAFSGGAGNDVLYGANGSDTLDGGTGNDLLITGAAGGDTMTGGAGADTFVFSAATATALNTITDFLAGTDIIGLSNNVFGYSTGQSVGFQSGAGADAAAIFGNAGRGFAYSTTTGGLWFDADWSNAGNAVQLATLTGAPTLTAGSFQVLA